jgi:hypothetical protein
MFAELALIDTEMHAWVNENDARLDLIKSALASLPEPEPPTVDWKAKAERVEHERNGWSQMHGDMKVRSEKAEAELARIIESAHEAGWNGVENPKDLAQFIKALAEEVGNRQAALLAACTNADELKGKADRWYNQAKSENVKYLAAVEEIQLLKTACDRMSEQEVLSLSQLRPLAEAGPVPEGCVRHYTYKQDGEWNPATKHRAMQDTHYIDIPRLPAPAEKPNPKPVEPLVTKPISLPLAESMTLRDWFAGKALTMLADPDFSASPEDTAKLVYRIADAMIAAREAKP